MANSDFFLPKRMPLLLIRHCMWNKITGCRADTTSSRKSILKAYLRTPSDDPFPVVFAQETPPWIPITMKAPNGSDSQSTVGTIAVYSENNLCVSWANSREFAWMVGKLDCLPVHVHQNNSRSEVQHPLMMRCFLFFFICTLLLCEIRIHHWTFHQCSP